MTTSCPVKACNSKPLVVRSAIRAEMRPALVLPPRQHPAQREGSILNNLKEKKKENFKKEKNSLPPNTSPFLQVPAKKEKKINPKILYP